MKTCDKAERTINFLLERGVELSDVERDAIINSFGQRGQYKGYLTKNRPSSSKNPLAATVWLAIQPNSYKISIGSILYLQDAERELYDKLSKFKYPSDLDKDLETLQNCGAW